jgi:hypothetical protein
MAEVKETTITRRAVGKRALAAAGGLAIASVMVAEAPLAAQYGRHLLAEELANLEGIALDAAFAAADATFEAAERIVEPIADVLSLLSANTLDGAIFAVERAEDFAGTLGENKDALMTLDAILQAWRTNVELFPQTIHDLNAVERDAGKKYLASLKAKQRQEADKTR